MMNQDEKRNIQSRLSKVKGQVAGIERMVEEDRYCVDVLTQVSAALSAMRRVEDDILYQHLHTCVANAMRTGEQSEQNEKVDEIIDLLSKFRNHG